MGPKGSPRKSMSVPTTITRIPASASASVTSQMPSSRNWASSMAATCGLGVDLFGELHGVGHGLGVDLPAVVRRDAEFAAVAVVEVGLEELNPPAGDEGTPYAPDQFLGLAAEHDAGDDLDPSVSGPSQHGVFPVLLASGRRSPKR